ncbi:MAG: OsmC family protein [Dehalococcoidia bacterium]
MTLRLYAERKGWPLGKVTVELSHEKVKAEDCDECEEGLTGLVDLIHIRTTVTGPLTGEQEARLREIAGRCPVHKTLRGRPQMVEDLVVQVPGG